MGWLGSRKLKKIGQSRGVKRTNSNPSKLSKLQQQNLNGSNLLTGTATEASIDLGTLVHTAFGQAEQILFQFALPNIAKFSPFIEEDGTIWVKGRLKHSNPAYVKHPIFLAAKHPVVPFLLERADLVNLHEGTEYVKIMLQPEYRIIGFRNALQKIKSHYIKCRHRKTNPIHLPRVSLRRERFDELVFPFTHTGDDYFWPFDVKFLQHTLKRWFCIFVCLTTRAVHIEVA